MYLMLTEREKKKYCQIYKKCFKEQTLKAEHELLYTYLYNFMTNLCDTLRNNNCETTLMIGEKAIIDQYKTELKKIAKKWQTAHEKFQDNLLKLLK